jgi:hypothetical protein
MSFIGHVQMYERAGTTQLRGEVFAFVVSYVTDCNTRPLSDELA